MDFSTLITFIGGLQIQQIVILGVMMWWFTKDIRSDLKEMKQELHDSNQELRSVNIRVSRMEGTVYGVDFYKKKD